MDIRSAYNLYAGLLVVYPPVPPYACPGESLAVFNFFCGCIVVGTRQSTLGLPLQGSPGANRGQEGGRGGIMRGIIRSSRMWWKLNYRRLQSWRRNARRNAQLQSVVEAEMQEAAELRSA
jgi:hypothetical protein